MAVDSLAQEWPTGSAGIHAESSHEEFLPACLLSEVAARESKDGRAASTLPVSAGGLMLLRGSGRRAGRDLRAFGDFSGVGGVGQ